MRIAWPWLLPVVPLLILSYASIHNYRIMRTEMKLGANIAQVGERFGCQLWASRQVRDDFRSAWGEHGLGCSFDPPTRLAVLLNLPAFFVSAWVSEILLERFDIPMAPTFYGPLYALSFLWWYTIGDWIERRRNARRKST
jgi:hypothetical protein